VTAGRRRPGRGDRARAWILLVVSAAVVAVLVGGVKGLVGGLIAVAGGAVAVRRIEPRHVRLERARAVADLPIAADLMAAAARAGAPPERAALVVGSALGGPVGTRLVEVSRSLRRGELPGDAWEHVADLPGGDRLASVATRSAERGSALTRALEHQAADLRVAQAVRAEAATRRIGVFIVVPLGLCFLPAFLLAGVVPLVAAVLDGLLGNR
jgi:pilus assembly protein TadC